MLKHSVPTQVSIDLGDNLRLRFARPDEVDTVVDFNTRIFDNRVSFWTRDLMSGRHPTVQATDFTVVEDTRSNQIISSLCVIPQTWAYSGIPFQVGRPELIATDPAYRRRGLVRKQFEFIHSRSAANGEMMQVITGVDWFYRQFGYLMGIKLWGSRWVEAARLLKIEEAESNGYRLRPALPSDYDFIQDVYNHAMHGQLFSAVPSPEQWAYEFEGRSKDNTRRREWLIIESSFGERLGYVQYLPCLASPHVPMFRIYQVELKPGVGYLNLLSDLLRGLWAKAKAMHASGDLPCKELQGLELTLERDHPLFRVLPKNWVREVKPSPWYIRLPDPVAFLRKVRPALEKHLIGTVAEGYSGEVKLNFYRGGLRLMFERGQITAIEEWFPQELSQGDARFPDSTFTQLLCGWRRVNDLTENYPDCSVKDDTAVLLDSMFPRFNGKVWVLT